MPDRSPPFLLALAAMVLLGPARAAAQDSARKGEPPVAPEAPSALPARTVGGSGATPGSAPDAGAGNTSSETPAPAAPLRRSASDPIRPPPLHVEYAQYGVGIVALVNLGSGAMCGANVRPAGAPCILGSGGGLVIRAGYRSPGPWYIGGGYSFAKMDSSNLFRLGILQQLWGEMRFLPDTGYRVAPFANWGVGGTVYGNEWGVETGGMMVFVGGGVQLEVSRKAVIGLGIDYKPNLIVGWTDTAGYQRPTGVAHFLGFDLQLEVRTETGRR